MCILSIHALYMCVYVCVLANIVNLLSYQKPAVADIEIYCYLFISISEYIKS